MSGLSLKIEVDGDEAYRLIEVATKIIQNHKSDLTEKEIEDYQKAVDRFSEKGIQVKA